MGARKTTSAATRRTTAPVASTAARGPRWLGTAKNAMAPIRASPPMTASRIAIRSPIVPSLPLCHNLMRPGAQADQRHDQLDSDQDDDQRLQQDSQRFLR